MPSSPSLAARAAAAVSLMVGFYVLAIAIAGLLIGIPVAEWFWAERIDPRIAIFCALGAIAILRSIAPRRDRFEAPGPLLLASEHPRLFTTLEDVARSTEQEMPAEVYLVPEVNAWVAQRGGVMGIASRRVMGLGLPLMAMLTVDELRAVLAHEFGHYHGGDTALGPWIYRTRSAIGRTLVHMARHSSWLVKPFEWYGAAFLRITHAISRRQEYAADALAARTVGAMPLATGLLAIEGAAAAFTPYWFTELAPVLERGFRPPIAMGFASFVSSPNVAPQLSAAVEQAITDAKVDVFDTHPPLGDRLRALGVQLTASTRTDAEPRAITLLGDLDGVEARLITFVSHGKHGSPSPIAWVDAGDRVWSALWRDRVQTGRALLAGLTPAQIPGLASDLAHTAVAFGFAPNREVAQKKGGDGEVAHLLASACAVALLDRGWSLSALPGETVVFSRGAAVITPFASIGALSTGSLSAEEWQASWRDVGLADLDLGAASAGLIE
jgi:Zn-dependent protease with chaperone function